jgi:hypothetical protein
MKIWFAVFALSLCVVLLKEITITIPYTYIGNRSNEVQKGLDTWLKAGYKFVHSSSTNNLIITHNTPEEFVLSQNAAGENVGNKIRISTRYPRTDSDIIGIVSHEAGHFLGLSHNTETNSVMNPDLPLTKRPSHMDIRRVKWNKINFLKYIF